MGVSHFIANRVGAPWSVQHIDLHEISISLQTKDGGDDPNQGGKSPGTLLCKGFGYSVYTWQMS